MKKISVLVVCFALILVTMPLWAAESVKTQAQLEELILKKIETNVTTEVQVRALLGDPPQVKEYTQTYLAGPVEWRLLRYGPENWVKVYKEAGGKGLVREKSAN